MPLNFATTLVEAKVPASDDTNQVTRPDLTRIEHIALRAEYLKRGIDEIVLPLKNGKKIDTSTLLGFQRFVQRIKHYLTAQNTLTSQYRECFFNNVYVQQLLQQVERYNACFNQVCVNHKDQGDQQRVRRLIKAGHMHELRLEPINGIPEYIQPGGITINVSTRVEETFTPAHVYIEEGHTRYYYAAKESTQTRHPHRVQHQASHQHLTTATRQSNWHSLAQGETMGRLRETLTGQEQRQRQDHFFRPVDHRPHQTDRRLFTSATAKICQGKPLSPDEIQLLKSSRYYRYPTQLFSHSAATYALPERVTTHIGHASELIQERMSPLPGEDPGQPVFFAKIASDPVHSHIHPIFYRRQTEAAFSAEDYAGVHAVVVTNSNPDHAELTTLRLLSQQGTAIIVPIGNKAKLEKAKVYNVIELSSWNAIANINFTFNGQSLGTLQLRALPAKHATGTPGQSDHFASLAMGFEINNVAHSHCKAVSGTTAPLSEMHYAERQQRWQKIGLTISDGSQCAGFDRPRAQLQETVQSTMDALVEAVRLLQSNLALPNRRESKMELTSASSTDDTDFEMGTSASVNSDPDSDSENETGSSSTTSYNVRDFPTLQTHLPRVSLYSHGCFRQGLQGYNDAELTVTRLLALLYFMDNTAIHRVTPNKLKEHFLYVILDNFERTGLQHLVEYYSKITIAGQPLTARQVADCICQSVFIPIPGTTMHVSQLASDKPAVLADNPHFHYDFMRLLVNRHGEDLLTGNAEFEQLVFYIGEILKYHDITNQKQQDEVVLKIYNKLATYGLQAIPIVPIENEENPPSVRSRIYSMLTVNAITHRHKISENDIRAYARRDTAQLLLYGLIFEPGFYQRIKVLYCSFIERNEQRQCPTGRHLEVRKLIAQREKEIHVDGWGEVLTCLQISSGRPLPR